MRNPVGSENGGKRSLLDGTDAVEGRTEQTVNDGFVMPDLIGRLLLPEGKRLPVGAGNDVKVRPAMTGRGQAGNDVEGRQEVTVSSRPT